MIPSVATSNRGLARTCAVAARKVRPEARLLRSQLHMQHRTKHLAARQWRSSQNSLRAFGLGSNEDGKECSSSESEAASPGSAASSSSESSSVKIDLNADSRRTLLVQFTCDKCETRSERLVNPQAYARGTVFVQCQGCEAWHQLVDHMGLIKEYDLRDQSTSKTQEQQG